MNFSMRLRELRESRGLSQEKLAASLKIPRSSITHYETSRDQDRLPRRERLEKIADFFNVTVDYLLGRTDDKGSSLNIAFSHGGEELTPDEKAHLEEELKRYRELKERFMAEKQRDEESRK